MSDLTDRLTALRARLDDGFALDTKSPGSPAHPPSAGHCAAVAAVVRALHGGAYVSATVDGVSHWFNRIDGRDYDLTGDQFGRPAVQAAPAGELYPGARERRPEEMRDETVMRALRLLHRAGGGSWINQQ